MLVKMTWKVYGRAGHTQRESYHPSYAYDFTDDRGTRLIEVKNFDLTGTHDYSVVSITRPTAKECKEEFDGQISDGLFENSATGKKVLIEQTVYYTVQEALQREREGK